jgi:hypothetical protein
MARPAQVLGTECSLFRCVRFGKQHKGTVVIDDKLVDNRLMRNDHLREGAFEALRKKCRELKKENGRLRNLLAEHGVAPASSPAMPSVEPAAVKLSLSTPEKSPCSDLCSVAARMSTLSAGRARTAAQAYSPRTARDWQAYYAAKPAPIGCHDGGICTIDGVPTSDIRKGFCRARLMEVTPEKEIVFDMWIDGSDENPALSLSSFRAEFLGESK